MRDEYPVQIANLPDKYESRDLPMIDCDRRLPLCRARCCKLPFALSQQDIDEGVVRWDPDRPYMIARKNKCCTHLENGRCSVYEQRPAVCRVYDCRNDERIWIDFESYIAQP